MNTFLGEEGKGADGAPGCYGGGEVEGYSEWRHERNERIQNQGAEKDLPYEVCFRVGTASYSFRRTV
jgi:hypothetical protein